MLQDKQKSKNKMGYLPYLPYLPYLIKSSTYACPINALFTAPLKIKKNNI